MEAGTFVRKPFRALQMNPFFTYWGENKAAKWQPLVILGGREQKGLGAGGVWLLWAGLRVDQGERQAVSDGLINERVMTAWDGCSKGK